MCGSTEAGFHNMVILASLWGLNLCPRGHGFRNFFRGLHEHQNLILSFFSNIYRSKEKGFLRFDTFSPNGQNGRWFLRAVKKKNLVNSPSYNASFFHPLKVHYHIILRVTKKIPKIKTRSI